MTDAGGQKQVEGSHPCQSIALGGLTDGLALYSVSSMEYFSHPWHAQLSF